MFKTFINCIILLSLCLNVLASSEDESATKKPEATDKNVFSKNLVKVNIKPKEILKSANHIGKKNLNIKKFPNDILGYTTPWNKAGENNVLECINKFTMVSPVWLRILHGEINDIFGTEDINNKWLSELRSSRLSRNVTIKILPRILFESWTVDSLSELYRNIQLRDRFIRTLYELAEYHHFDGYVLELWNPYLASKSKKATITNLINEIAKGLKKKYLYTVLVIPPHRGSSDVSFTEKDFNSLVKNVHAFSLMTYDYSNMQNPGPNAPLSWIRKSIEYICPNQDDPNRKKILMGLNFYGYFYTHSGGRAILGHEYLKMLKSYKGDLKWDHKSKEHFFELTSTNSDGEHGFVFYPTLYSISKRIELATEMNTGIAIWELGQGLDFFFDLL